jgi:hypothetical protein
MSPPGASVLCRLCHPDDPEHRYTQAACVEACLRIHEACGHSCPKRCCQPCGNCEKVVREVPLPCGHVARGVPCFRCGHARGAWLVLLVCDWLDGLAVGGAQPKAGLRRGRRLFRAISHDVGMCQTTYNPHMALVRSKCVCVAQSKSLAPSDTRHVRPRAVQGAMIGRTCSLSTSPWPQCAGHRSRQTLPARSWLRW